MAGKLWLQLLVYASKHYAISHLLNSKLAEPQSQKKKSDSRILFHPLPESPGFKCYSLHTVIPVQIRAHFLYHSYFFLEIPLLFSQSSNLLGLASYLNCHLPVPVIKLFFPGFLKQFVQDPSCNAPFQHRITHGHRDINIQVYTRSQNC